MTPGWFCEIGGRQYGPVSAARLKHLVMEGKLRPTDLVWREGTQKAPAQAVKCLFSNAKQAAPPAPSKPGAGVALEVTKPIEKPPPVRKKPAARTFAEV